MEDLLAQAMPFLIVMPLAFLAGFVDSIAGGGGLISLPGYIMTGLPMHMVLGTNKLTSTMGTAVSTLRYAKEGFIKPKRVLPCIAMAFLGSAIGANLALLIPDGVFRIIMLFAIPTTALYLMRGRSFDANEQSPFDARSIAVCMLIACCLGVYDGLYGPGTGTFFMIAFTGIARLTLNDAAGTTKAVNLTTNLAALIVFLANGQVWLVLGLVGGAFNMLGNYFGSKLFLQNGSSITRPIMFVVLAIFLVKTIYELVVG